MRFVIHALFGKVFQGDPVGALPRSQTWRPYSNRNVCHWVLLWKRKLLF